nr:hypothetical protein [Tanacetum cinerariifolium]
MDSFIPLGQKNTLAEYMILSGADNRPPMLDKDLYDSWKSRMELYMQNREHGRMILESVENGPLIWPTVEENGEFTDELTLITYPPDYDNNLQCDIESDLREIEFLLYQGKVSDLKDSIDQTDLANLDAYFVDPTPEMFTDEHAPDYLFPLRFNMFTDEHAPDYLFPLRFNVYDDDFLEIESDAGNFYDDHFDSKGEKIKESTLLIDELDLPCDFLPYPEYDSFNS